MPHRSLTPWPVSWPTRRAKSPSAWKSRRRRKLNAALRPRHRSVTLLAQFVNGNASQKIGLDILARSMGLAGKLEGMDGSQVAEAFYQRGASQLIEDYCAVDVLITYGVYLGVQRFRGILDLEQFAECARQFEKFLRHEGRPPPYRILAEQSREYFEKSQLKHS